MRRMSGSVIRNAAVDLRLSIFCRLERLPVVRVTAVLLGCKATSAMVRFPRKFPSEQAGSQACLTLSVEARRQKQGRYATAARDSGGPPRSRRRSAPHEAFALSFGPGEHLFHRFALVIAPAHLGQ